jgi:hypothetical protein
MGGDRGRWWLGERPKFFRALQAGAPGRDPRRASFAREAGASAVNPQAVRKSTRKNKKKAEQKLGPSPTGRYEDSKRNLNHCLQGGI